MLGAAGNTLLLLAMRGLLGMSSASAIAGLFITAPGCLLALAQLLLADVCAGASVLSSFWSSSSCCLPVAAVAAMMPMSSVSRLPGADFSALLLPELL